MNTDNLKKEHCWRIISVIGVKTVYTYDELNKELEKIKALKIECLVQKIW